MVVNTFKKSANILLFLLLELLLLIPGGKIVEAAANPTPSTCSRPYLYKLNNTYEACHDNNPHCEAIIIRSLGKVTPEKWCCCDTEGEPPSVCQKGETSFTSTSGDCTVCSLPAGQLGKKVVTCCCNESQLDKLPMSACNESCLTSKQCPIECPYCLPKLVGKIASKVCSSDDSSLACDMCSCSPPGSNIFCPNCNIECKQCFAPGGTFVKGGSWTALGCIPTSDFTEFVSWLLKRIFAVAGGIAFLLVIFGGFRIITSAGDPKGVQAAKETITSALIGLLFIIFSVFLLELIGVKILGIPGL